MRPRSSSRDHRERNLGGIRERNPGKVLVEFERNAGGIREECQVTSAAFAADFGGLRGGFRRSSRWILAVFAADFGRASAGLLRLIKFLHKSGPSSPRSGN